VRDIARPELLIYRNENAHVGHVGRVVVLIGHLIGFIIGQWPAARPR